MISRRSLAATAAGAVMTAATMTAASAAPEKAAISFGNPDLPPQGAINTRSNPRSITDPGPQSPALASKFPSPQFAAGDRRRQHAAALGLVQQCGETHPERRVGPPGHPV